MKYKCIKEHIYFHTYYFCDCIYSFYIGMSGKQVVRDEKKIDYMADAKKVLALAKSYTENNTWEHVVTTEGTELYKYDMPSVCPTPCYLTKTKINQPMDKVVNWLWKINEDGAKENDPSVLDWREIEKTDNFKIVSQHNKTGLTGWVFWPREIVFLQAKFENKDENTVNLVACSVEHPSVPLNDKKYVRARLHMSVYTFKADGPNATKIQRVTQLDPCGSIPVSIVNWFATGQVRMFNNWKKR